MHILMLKTNKKFNILRTVPISLNDKIMNDESKGHSDVISPIATLQSCNDVRMIKTPQYKEFQSK
jgi:hypothetical protein